MSVPDQTELATEISERIWTLNERIDLTHFIVEWLKSKGIPINSGWSLANFDRLNQLVRNALSRRIEDCRERGITPKYRISDLDSDILIPLVEREVELVQDAIKEAIKSLPPIAFERFCAHLVGLMGVEMAKTMRGTKEEGVDFFGVLNVGIPLQVSTLRHVKVRILGQAKLSYVGQPPIRLFSRDIQSFGEKEGEAWKLAPKWFKSLKLPIVGVFVSGKDLSAPARKWASSHNIGAADLDQVVEDLLKSEIETPGVYKSETTLTFDREAFVRSFTKKKAPSN